MYYDMTYKMYDKKITISLEKLLIRGRTQNKNVVDAGVELMSTDSQCVSEVKKIENSTTLTLRPQCLIVNWEL